MSFLPKFADERFFRHRQRSTSIAGICTGVLALLLFLYRLLYSHVVMWELFAVGATFSLVKVALMIWYSYKD